MKWAKKKKGSSISSHHSLINHLFPISWFSKFKLINGGCSEKIPKQKMQQQEAILQKDQSFKKPNSRKLEKKQSQKGEKKTEQIDEKEGEKVIFEVQPDRITRSRKSPSVSDPNCKFSSKDQSFIKFKQSQKEEKKTEQIAAKEAEKTIFEVEPDPITRKRRSFSYPNCKISSIKQEFLLEVLNLDDSSTMPENPGFLEDIKIKKDDEITGSISNCKRKKRHNKNRTKPYSPRTMAKIECKIKAIEEMKKSRKRGKMKVGFDDSYAVTKNSFDPRRDFRDSMIEMIVVKGIEKAEDLEKLLACYLTLNCDQYHDLIIKVFRQVWFELNDHDHDHDHIF